MFEVYTDELFSMIDMDEFVKNEIEGKGIVVIDEIDKLVRSVRIFILILFSLIVQAQPKLVMRVFSMISCLYLMAQLSMWIKVSIQYLNCLETKINTRNILFVGAGAFEKVKPSELAIELQGRMPIQAKMETLTKSDLIKILKETEYNLLMQSIELLKIEGVNIVF